MSDSNKSDPPKPSGRVRHDSGGRAIWEWAVDSGKHAINSTSQLLKKLDLSGLHLTDEHGKKEADQADAEEEAQGLMLEGEGAPAAKGKAGFNPYDRRAAPAQRATPTKPKPPAKPRITQPVVVSKKKQGFFARLFGKK